MFEVYKEVADSGDVDIEKRGFSIFDTYEPAISMPLLSAFLYMMDTQSYGSKIFQVGRRRGIGRFVSPGLQHIESVSSHCRMLNDYNEPHTSSVIYWD